MENYEIYVLKVKVLRQNFDFEYINLLDDLLPNNKTKQCVQFPKSTNYQTFGGFKKHFKSKPLKFEALEIRKVHKNIPYKSHCTDWPEVGFFSTEVPFTLSVFSGMVKSI